jgi:PPK2 family polyphosphate:nucleotide phosphotransferase
VKLPKTLIEELQVQPGEAARLHARSTSETRTKWTGAGDSGSERDIAAVDLESFKQELALSQELLYATERYALLVIIQALDAAGKDGTIKHVMSGVNPQGCSVVSFKTPSSEELGHDFLWRCAKVLPTRGSIGIFNRSYYEEVLVTRVHPEILDQERLPLESKSGEGLWDQRFEEINAFEQHLHLNGTRVVKLFLHVSKDEQKKRLLERLEDPSKNWKFSASDLRERAYFDLYHQAYEEAINATSTSWAPWYVIPADHKSAMRTLVGGVLTHTIEQLDLRFPEMTAEQREVIEKAKSTLLAE